MSNTYQTPVKYLSTPAKRLSNKHDTSRYAVDGGESQDATSAAGRALEPVLSVKVHSRWVAEVQHVAGSESGGGDGGGGSFVMLSASGAAHMPPPFVCARVWACVFGPACLNIVRVCVLKCTCVKEGGGGGCCAVLR
jgi:hypothetical protein